jgi:hydrogenase maturation protease
VTLPVQPLVVIGVGNILRRDDAVGVRVVESLREIQEHDPVALPDQTRLVDGGTLLMDLLPAVRGARGLVLVDALRLGEPEGTVSVQHGDAIVPVSGAGGQQASPLGELLAAGRLMGWLPEPVALVGVEVTHIDFGTELTPVVAAVLPAAVDAVRQELRVMDEQIAALRFAGGSHTETTGAPA